MHFSFSNHKRLSFSVLSVLVMFSLCLLGNSLFGQSGLDFNIQDFGAVGDGFTLNTEAIQKAVDKASQRVATAMEAGDRDARATVVFPAGSYLSGTLQLKSNVTLHLDKGAVLLGSTDPKDYHALDRPGHPVSPKQDDNSAIALIAAFKAENIGITGPGTIDGQGTALALHIDSLIRIGQMQDPNYARGALRPSETLRPKLLLFSLCRDVQLEGATLKNSACWGLSFELCERLRLSKLQVVNMAYWNNDGTDLTDCKNVRITDCEFNTADDGICLKSYYPGHANDSFYIADCRVRSGASAIKFGTASYGGFKNISIHNIEVYDTYRSAIAIESVDGAAIENVKVTDITARSTGNAVFIRLGHRAGAKPGSIKNVYIGHIKVQIPFGRPDMAYDLRATEPGFHNTFPASITGIPGAEVENIKLEDIEITYPGRASRAQAYFSLSRLSEFPEKVQNYPEFSMFGEVPAWGLFIRHAKNIQLSNIRLQLAADDFRAAIVMDDVNGVTLHQIKLPKGYHTGQILVKDGKEVQLKSSDGLAIERL